MDVNIDVTVHTLLNPPSNIWGNDRIHHNGRNSDLMQDCGNSNGVTAVWLCYDRNGALLRSHDIFDVVDGWLKMLHHYVLWMLLADDTRIVHQVFSVNGMNVLLRSFWLISSANSLWIDSWITKWSSAQIFYINWCIEYSNNGMKDPHGNVSSLDKSNEMKYLSFSLHFQC